MRHQTIGTRWVGSTKKGGYKPGYMHAHVASTVYMNTLLLKFLLIVIKKNKNKT